MAKQNKTDHSGEHDGISRRDFLNGTLLASGGLLLDTSPVEFLTEEDWTGYGGVGDYATSNGNTYEVVTAGHAIRDRTYDRKSKQEPIDTGEHYDCVVVGAGISGLAATLFLKRRRPNATCLIIDNHPIFGGEAKRNEFLVDGQRLMAHQGSAVFFPPFPDTYFDEFYKSIGLDWHQFHYQEWAGTSPPMKLGTDPYTTGGKNSGFFFGSKFGHPKGIWLTDPWGKKLAGAPIPDSARAEWLKTQDPTHDHPEKSPKEHGDDASRYLDRITLEQDMMEKYGVGRETVRRFLSTAGGGSGLGPDALSAYSEYAADVLFPWDQSRGSQMFPGGNTGIARYITKAILPDALRGPTDLASVCRTSVNFKALDRKGQKVRIRLRATVISVRHEGPADRADAVHVVYERGGKLYRIKARSVIMAGGSWTSKHVVRDLPRKHSDAYAQFYRSPCLMMNVALRNWRFLYKLGISECQWFEGFGQYTAVRRTALFGSDSATIGPDSPTVLTLKILYSRPGLPIQDQVTQGRWEMMSTSFHEYERQLREQFATMFSTSGFNVRRDIAGIILNRWGHAYLSPQPGFFFGTREQPAPGEVLRQNPFGRIAFANSDLSGIMDHRASIMEADRAVNQVLTAT
jgi:spermidine dehydrogenase